MTDDLVGVNQRLMPPYFGDLAEWLCKAVSRPGQMADRFISIFHFRDMVDMKAAGLC